MKKIILGLFIIFFPLLGFSQINEGFEGATFPPTTPGNWSVFDNGVGTTQSWTVTNDPTRVYSGTQAAIVDRENIGSGNSSQDWLVTSQFTVPANGQLRFFTRRTLVGNRGTNYEVKFSTNAVQNNQAAYVALPGGAWTDLTLNTTYNVYEERVVNFPIGIVGQQVYIAFIKTFNQPTTQIGGDRWLIDEVKVVERCLDPSAQNITNLASVSATLNWTNNAGVGIPHEIEIYQNPGTPTGVGVPSPAPNSFLATGLTPGTDYQFRVRALCPSGINSSWIGPFLFSTKPAGSICATPITISSLPFSQTSNTNLYGDEVDIPQGAGCAGGTTNYLQGFEVFYSYTPTVNQNISITMTPSNPNTAIFVYNGCANVGVSCLAGVANTGSTPRVIPTLAVVAGQTYVFVISTNTTTQTTPYSLVIQPVTCAPPAALTATSIGTATANLSWSNPTTATAWEVAVQTAGGVIPSGAGTPATTNTNFAVSTLLSGAPLTSGTAYQYWVRSECSPGVYSPWAGPFLFNTSICELADQCTYNFRLESTTAQWSGARMEVRQNGVVVATLGAQFTTGTLLNVPVVLCQNYPFELFWTLGGTVPTRVKVSIINNFTQTIYTKAAGIGSSNTSLYNTAFNCSTPACLDPTAGAATAITTTTANLGWTSTGATLWDVYLVPNLSPAPTATTTPTYAGITTNPLSVTGLTQLTTYQYYVRVVCTATSNNSKWAGPYTFTTLPTCPNPTTLTTTLLTATSVTLGWTNVGPATAWEVLYLPCGAAAPTATTTGSVPAPTNPFLITGLVGGTCYDIYVRSVCSPTDSSPWSVKRTITTPPGCGSLFIDNGADTTIIGNYANSSDNTYTICPTNPGDIVTVTFTSFATEATYDGLYVFDGNSITSPLISSGNPGGSVPGGLAGSFWGEPGDTGYVLPGPFTSTNTNGCLTFRFRSDGSVNRAGWIANVACNPPPTCAKPLTLGANTITQTTANLTWVQPATPGTASSWEIIVQLATLGNPTGAGTPTNTNPYVTTGLLPGTAYEFYVRANCGATDGLSTWAGPFAFGTIVANDECINAITVPVNEDASCALFVSGSIVGATGSLPTTTCGGTANDDVWFKFVASSDKHYISMYNVVGSTTDLNHVVYSGACGSLVQFGACQLNNNSIVSGLTFGSTYYVRVYTATATANQTTTFNMCIGTVSICSTAEATCSDPADPFIFPNTTGVPSEGQQACLFTNPNPTYYFMTVLQSGNLQFQISQNTSFNTAGLPTGTGLDVDFVAWGPFTSNSAACGNLGNGCPTPGACPNNTTNPNFYPYFAGNIMDCSYSLNAVENFNILNAIAGQVYVIVITNFNGAPGFIRFDQTNFGTPGSGQTDCSIVCEVDLGPNQELCGVTSVPLDSQLANPLATFTWKKDGVLIPGALSQTYTATSSGTYTCIGKCGPNDVTDSVVINLGPNVIVPEQANYTLCDDASNDGIASFDLTTLTPNVLIGLDTNFTYNVTYHYTEANALANTNAINPNVLYIGASQTIYIRITTVGATSCNTVVAQNLVVNSLPIATISSTDSDNTICSDEISASKIIVTPSNFAIANATYVWSLDGIVIPGAITNEIVPTLTGTYSVVVTLASGCSNTTALDLLFTINTKPDFALTGTNLVKCADEVAVLSVIPTNFTVTDPNISYIWKLDGNVLTGMNTSSISETDYGVYSVEITNFQCKTIQQITVTLDTTEIPINTNGECVGINYILTASPVSSSYDPETVTYLWTNQSGVPVGSNQETFNVSEYVIENGISFDTFPLTFNVKVTTNPDGCTDNQSFEVITSFCTVQKGLSPNGDGSNDYFDLRGLDVKELSVFNRYGTKIYSKTNYKNEWRGQNSKSENSPVGTYYYVIEQKNGETKTGWIYLNR